MTTYLEKGFEKNQEVDLRKILTFQLNIINFLYNSSSIALVLCVYKMKMSTE